MGILRASALTSMVLSLALAAGCSSDSKSGDSQSEGRHDASADVRRNEPRDAPYTPSPDTASPGAACEMPTSTGTVTVQPNRSVTINCITWTCKGNGNFTSTGVACSDAGPVQTNRDVRQDKPLPGDVAIFDISAPVDGGRNDVQPTGSGEKDTAPTDLMVDVGSTADGARIADGASIADGARIADGTAPEDLGPDLVILPDTATPEPDSAILPDTAPIEVCISETGQKYYAGGGVCFRCAGNMCICDSNAVIAVATTANCLLPAF
jgi:hypothetical protein